MSKVLFVFFFFAVSICGAQTLTFDKLKFDFGNLEPYDHRYVDFLLTNKGTKKEWILSVKKPQEVVYLNSRQFIDKDSTGILRFQVNPKQKGKFSYEIEVFTSDRAEAVKLKISGNLLEMDINEDNAFTACPDFNSRPGGVDPNQFKLKVITVDEETRDVLSNSSVLMIQNGREAWTKRTDKVGEIKEEGTIGFSYFYASHEGYFPTELGTYINFNRNTVVLKLKRGELPEPPVDTSLIVIVQEPTPVPEGTPVELPPAFTDLDKDNFDPQYFNSVNVVFVLDISSSMKQADKMELMKYSLAQLTAMLRPQDKITLVTYSSDAQVYMRSMSGADKDEILQKVEELTAFGFTAGGTGIKLGFKEANKNFLSDGENQVVIITDGAFNRDSDDYLKSVKKYAKKGIRFSVVGIRNKEVDREKMIESAVKGNGFYISVMDLADAQQNLKQAIRLVAFRKH